MHSATRSSETVSLGKATRQLTEAPGGRAIEIINRPLKSGGWVATIEDITERKRAEEKIAHLAHYDGLTELPNRDPVPRAAGAVAEGDDGPASNWRCSISTSTSSRASTTRSAIRSATSCSRASPSACATASSETDVAARLGGDEFAVIQTAIKDRSETTRLVDRNPSAIRQPFECIGHLITTDASIGIALAPGDGSISTSC